MSSELFSNFLYFQIEKFVNEYVSLSKSVFVNKNGDLIHPAEFGTYRERIVSKFLMPLMPKRLSIGTGFIITDTGKTSTQCDIIIYDTQNTPVIENGEQRFFPVECVAGVVEVKSKLSKTDLKTALIKLSKIKALRNEISSKINVYSETKEPHSFSPATYPKDQMATFLICESLSFDLEKECDSFFKDVYKDIEPSLFHNMILSVGQFCSLYHDGKGVIYLPFYQSNSIHKNCLVFPVSLGYKYEHIVAFLDFFYMLISSVTIKYVEFTQYISSQRMKRTYIEKE